MIQRGVAIDQAGPASLTICFIERLPKLDFVQNSPDPAVEGWPAPGARVTWRARLKNWSTQTLEAVPFEWRLDGALVSRGALAVGPLAEATVDLPWRWERRRHEVEITVDPEHRYTVAAGTRHRLLVHTDALSLAFYAERSLYDYFRAHQHELRVGNSSFEDWAQFQIEAWNLMSARAVYPETPQGVLDRWRLDAVHVVEDDTVPARELHGTMDPTVDLRWGFPATTLDAYSDRRSPSTDNQFYYSGYIQHEIGHVRYLVDVHTFNLYEGRGTHIDLREGTTTVPGSVYMPARATLQGPGGESIRVYETPYRGLMNADWTFMDRYSAAALNLIAGHRAVAGNTFVPDNYGVFMDDLPARNRLTVEDGAGRPLSDASVKVYQSVVGGPTSGSTYARYFDNIPELDLVADASGRVEVGRNPFTPGRMSEYNPVAIVRVAHEGRVGYGFLDVADFSLRYWGGQREQADHELRVQLR